MSNYRIVFGKQDMGYRMSSLYRQRQLAVGILDFGTREELSGVLSWYTQSIKAPIHVMTTEYRFEEYEIEKEFPEVSFIVFKNDTTTGEFVNALANECYSDYFLVVRTDMDLISYDGNTLNALMTGSENPSVICPVMVSSQGEVLPTVRAPYVRERDVDPQSFVPQIEDDKPTYTLYPVLGTGLYDRALFQRLRGFDTEIQGEYFQTLDFGVRSWLFGYTVMTTRSLAVQFPKRISIIEDRSECPGFERFYTKALSIKRIAGKNVVSKWKPYVDKVALMEVKQKQINLQRTDFFTLVEKWGAK